MLQAVTETNVVSKDDNEICVTIISSFSVAGFFSPFKSRNNPCSASPATIATLHFDTFLVNFHEICPHALSVVLYGVNSMCAGKCQP